MKQSYAMLNSQSTERERRQILKIAGVYKSYMFRFNNRFLKSCSLGYFIIEYFKNDKIDVEGNITGFYIAVLCTFLKPIEFAANIVVLCTSKKK